MTQKRGWNQYPALVAGMGVALHLLHSVAAEGGEEGKDEQVGKEAQSSRHNWRKLQEMHDQH